eukprot:12759779-Alexandrium_andersonii.AAC.1
MRASGALEHTLKRRSAPEPEKARKPFNAVSVGWLALLPRRFAHTACAVEVRLRSPRCIIRLLLQ